MQPCVTCKFNLVWDLAVGDTGKVLIVPLGEVLRSTDVAYSGGCSRSVTIVLVKQQFLAGLPCFYTENSLQAAGSASAPSIPAASCLFGFMRKAFAHVIILEFWDKPSKLSLNCRWPCAAAWNDFDQCIVWWCHPSTLSELTAHWRGT
jgi:hypothetical protein